MGVEWDKEESGFYLKFIGNLAGTAGAWFTCVKYHMVPGGQWVVDSCYGRLEASKEVRLQSGWLRRDTEVMECFLEREWTGLAED